MHHHLKIDLIYKVNLYLVDNEGGRFTVQSQIELQPSKSIEVNSLRKV